jgi:hypothetical protein
VLHDEFAHFAEEAYHETNRWLIQQRVLPEIDLRPSSGAPATPPGAPARRRTGRFGLRQTGNPARRLTARAPTSMKKPA